MDFLLNALKLNPLWNMKYLTTIDRIIIQRIQWIDEEYRHHRHSSFINTSRHLDLIGFVKKAFVKPTRVETSCESNIGTPERPKLKTDAGLCEWRHATIDTACAHRYASKCRTAVVECINHLIRFYGNHCGSHRIYRHAEWKKQSRASS